MLWYFSINIRVKEGSFIGIVGQVGSGKSTLLSAVLGETEKLAGDVKVKVMRNKYITVKSIFSIVCAL